VAHPDRDQAPWRCGDLLSAVNFATGWLCIQMGTVLPRACCFTVQVNIVNDILAMTRVLGFASVWRQI
jgi:hypothetical protein